MTPYKISEQLLAQACHIGSCQVPPMAAGSSPTILANLGPSSDSSHADVEQVSCAYQHGKSSGTVVDAADQSAGMGAPASNMPSNQDGRRPPVGVQADCRAPRKHRDWPGQQNGASHGRVSAQHDQHGTLYTARDGSLRPSSFARNSLKRRFDILPFSDQPIRTDSTWPQQCRAPSRGSAWARPAWAALPSLPGLLPCATAVAGVAWW